jgi:bacterial/archaeal transporter family protein
MKTNIFIITAVLGWGLGSFFYKIANSQVHPVLVSTIAMGLYIVLLPVMWLVIKFDHTITTSGIIYALIGSLCMCVATLSFSYALRSGGEVGRVTILCALYPTLTLILSIIFLNESMTIKKGIGIVLALISFAILA